MLNKNEFLGALAKAGFTQRKLAELIGMSKNTLCSRVNGKSYFDTEEIDKICEALNIVSSRQKSEIFLSQSSQNRDKIVSKYKEVV